MEEAVSMLYTHIDCPYCDNTFEVEGDQRGSVVTCDHCDKEMLV